MNTNDPLDELLSEWRVQVDTPASFRREVWSRIEIKETQQPSFLESLAIIFMKPAMLSVSLAVAVTFGGLVSLSTHQEGHKLNPRESYVRSIDPFNPTHLFAHR